MQRAWDARSQLLDRPPPAPQQEECRAVFRARGCESCTLVQDLISAKLHHEISDRLASRKEPADCRFLHGFYCRRRRCIDSQSIPQLGRLNAKMKCVAISAPDFDN